MTPNKKSKAEKVCLSVVMPVRDGERFIGDAIASVLAQTFADFEFLIIDDGSTDRTIEIIESFNDPRIKILPNKGAPYVAGALTYGCRHAYGEFVARMDADDVCMPDRFKKQVEFLRQNPKVGVVGSDYSWIDGEGHEKPGKTWNPPQSHEAICCLMYMRCPICHPTVMMRRNIIDQLGWYESKTLQGRRYVSEDLELWCRAIEITKFANMSEVLLEYRIHDDNVSLAEEGRQEHLISVALTIQRYIHEMLGLELSLDTCLLISGEKAGSMIDRQKAISVLAAIGARAQSSIKKIEEKSYTLDLVSKRIQEIIWDGGIRVFRSWFMLFRHQPRVGFVVGVALLRRLY
jgi:glycosyltransferase involved in cell wall biosynthesis